jgi:GT2 family glycosyltransferase
MAAPVPDPLVYILLLNWDGWRDTLACLDSLKHLAYKNYRVLVIDNGSSDDSINRIREAYPSVLLIEAGANLGFAGGNNTGISHALESGAKYIWVLNNDTTVDSDSLGAMVSIAEADPEVGAVGSVLYELNLPDKIQAWGGGWVNLWLGFSRLYRNPVLADRLHFLSGASMLLRREAIDEAGSFDTGFFMYWEDTDLGFRLRKAGWKLAVTANSKVWHKGSSSLGGNNSLLDKYFDTSAVRFFKRHAPVPALPIAIGKFGRILKRQWRHQNILRAKWWKAKQ